MSRIVRWAAACSLAWASAGCGGEDAEPGDSAPATIAVGGVLDAFPAGTSTAAPPPPPTDPPATTAGPVDTVTAQPEERTELAERLAGVVDDESTGRPPTELVTDDTRRLSLAVPADWADRTTGTASPSAAAPAPYVAASPDVRRFLDGYDEAGLTVVVLTDADDVAAAVESYRFTEDCGPGAGGVYVGRQLAGEYRVWRDCGGTSTDIVTVVGELDGATVLLLAQIRESADLVAVDIALDTVTVR